MANTAAFKELLAPWAEAAEEVAKGNETKALSLLQGVENKNAKIWFNIAQLQFQKGNYSECISAIEESLSKDQYSVVTTFLKGLTSFKTQQFQQAYNEFIKCESRFQDNIIIDYKQLGLKFKLCKCEVFHNLALACGKLGNTSDETRYRKKASNEGFHLDDTHAPLATPKAASVPLYVLPNNVIYTPDKKLVRNMNQKIKMKKSEVVTSWKEDDKDIGSFAQVADNVFAAKRMQAATEDLKSGKASATPVAIVQSNLPPPPSKKDKKDKKKSGGERPTIVLANPGGGPPAVPPPPAASGGSKGPPRPPPATSSLTSVLSSSPRNNVVGAGDAGSAGGGGLLAELKKRSTIGGGGGPPPPNSTYGPSSSSGPGPALRPPPQSTMTTTTPVSSTLPPAAPVPQPSNNSNNNSSSGDGKSLSDEISSLAKLYQEGLLSKEEFIAAKAKILSSSESLTPAPAPAPTPAPPAASAKPSVPAASDKPAMSSTKPPWKKSLSPTPSTTTTSSVKTTRSSEPAISTKPSWVKNTTDDSKSSTMRQSTGSVVSTASMFNKSSSQASSGSVPRPKPSFNGSSGGGGFGSPSDISKARASLSSRGQSPDKPGVASLKPALKPTTAASSPVNENISDGKKIIKYHFKDTRRLVLPPGTTFEALRVIVRNKINTLSSVPTLWAKKGNRMMRLDEKEFEAHLKKGNKLEMWVSPDSNPPPYAK